MGKLTLFAALLFVSVTLFAQQALVIVDIQDFYFPGGRSELVEPAMAGDNAAMALNHFRISGLEIVHVRHNFEPGGEIHESVYPVEGEKIVSKDNVNAFKGTDLLEHLKGRGIDTLVICGMQTHMCVEAAVRAGADYGFKVFLLHDACATRDLKFGDMTVGWEDVHNATLATLRSYATVLSTDQYLKLQGKKQ